jgi:hypothetical protein
MTTYIKQLLEQIDQKYGQLPNDQFVRKLIEIGVIDFRLCRILAVREWVFAEVKAGAKKTDTMWRASEHFGCTYEYVRKCMYYYNDVNFK